MKKLLLSLIVCFVFSSAGMHVQAQSRPGFGIRGGLNIASLNDVNSDANIDSRTGFMVGAFANFLVPNSPVSIQPEVLYTQKGAESDDLLGNGTDTKVKLDYIEIPVLAKFDFITNGNITPNVYFGPYIGFNINAEAEASNSEATLSGDISDDVKGTDFGVVVGGGLDFGRFDVGVRYGAGLTDVFENADGKNGVFSVTAAIGF